MFEFKSKQDFIATAQGIAWKHRGKHDYLPMEHAAIHQWQPHTWVVEAMEKAYTQGLEDSKMLNTRCCEDGTQ